MEILKQTIVISVIIFLGAFSLSHLPNDLTPRWWENATFEDVEKRFKSYRHFDRQDKDGRSLLMLSLIYGKDPYVPAYFLLRGENIYHQDKKGKTAYDYALKNPNMKEIAEVIYDLTHLDLSEVDEKDSKEGIRSLKSPQKYELKREVLEISVLDQSQTDESEEETGEIVRPPLHTSIIRKVLQKHFIEE